MVPGIIFQLFDVDISAKLVADQLLVDMGAGKIIPYYLIYCKRKREREKTELEIIWLHSSSTLLC